MRRGGCLVYFSSHGGPNGMGVVVDQGFIAPGVLAHMNQVLAEHDVNIGGQVLATRGHTGYAVTDTGSTLSSQVVAALRAVPETVRVRVLD